MTTKQKVTTVKAKVYCEPSLDVVEWKCPKCKQDQKQYTYRIKDNKLQCENCGKISIREK